MHQVEPTDPNDLLLTVVATQDVADAPPDARAQHRVLVDPGARRDFLIGQLELKALMVGDVKVSARIQKDNSKLTRSYYQAGWDLKFECFVKDATKATTVAKACALSPLNATAIKKAETQLRDNIKEQAQALYKFLNDDDAPPVFIAAGPVAPAVALQYVYHDAVSMKKVERLGSWAPAAYINVRLGSEKGWAPDGCKRALETVGDASS